jgi:hypothetical protein
LYKVFVVDCVIIERIERKAGEKEEWKSMRN